MKKTALFLLLLTLGFVFSGCGTAKGAAVGVGAAGVSVAQGVKNDWDAAKKIDAWMQKNLW